MDKTIYSLIFPVYNEETNIIPLYERVIKVIRNLKDSYEIIFINDGSKDDTLKILKILRQKDKNIKIINFSRNFGHQIAVTAGLEYSSGKYIAVLDADLQDPPEILPKFFTKLKNGYDVVYAVRKKRKEGFVKKLAYATFYRLLNKIASIDIPLDTGDFCVMSHRIVKDINSMPERNRFVRGLRSWAGYKQIGISYERKERFSGKSKYTLVKLFKLAYDGIFSFSYIPLKILLNFGLLLLILSVFFTFIVIYLRYFSNIFVPGFPTTIILIMFFGGLQMFSIGIMGEYLGRIYDEVKQRPNYIVESTYGFNKK